MSDTKRLTNRNEQVAAMLADGEQLKNFYRFIAQNPHINLHDACQIIIERPNATVCFSFNEWAAMDRRVTKGRKGIAYYDRISQRHSLLRQLWKSIASPSCLGNTGKMALREWL